MTGIAFQASDVGPMSPSGGNFPNNRVSDIVAANSPAGLFSGDPALKTMEQLYKPASGGVRDGGGAGGLHAPPVSMAPIPAASNFGSYPFPIAYYDPNLDYGDPMQVVQGGVRG